jgi:hypothetical protein
MSLLEKQAMERLIAWAGNRRAKRGLTLKVTFFKNFVGA